MFKKKIKWIKIKFYKFVASYKSKETYPESIELNLNDLLTKTRPIKITIIDDEPFPWIDAIENRGCLVQYYTDYTKSIIQSNQKNKAIKVGHSDIIICDINKVGSIIYPNLDGVGVIEDLRRKHPFHVIIAYTGNPKAIHAKLKKQTALDGIMVKDWGIEDFLLNLDDFLAIYKHPSQRWEFIKNRLKHLGVKDKEINQVRMKYVENMLLSKSLKEKFDFDAKATQEMLTKETSISMPEFTKLGIGAANIAQILSPFVLSLNGGD